ncbi:MAG TPA: hypothetical protein VF815_23715, partial [Myxococcaceae bacterium]
INLARTQSAKMHELKAVTALGELLMAQGQAAQAREQLAPLLQWFSAAPNVPDIARARALLASVAT